MSIADELYRAALATPDDDGPRLVLADWYESEGRPERAELIRVQVEAAAVDPADRRARALAQREAAILARHGAAFRAELPALEGIAWDRFERGLVCSVRVNRVASLLHHADALPRLAPVHTAEIGTDPTALDLPPPRAVPWLRTLRIAGSQSGHWLELKDAEVAAIRALLPTIERLELVDLEAEDQVAATVLDGSPLPRCVAIAVSGNHTVGRAFAAQVAPLRLTELRLGTDFVNYDTGYFQDPTLGPGGVEALATAPALADLEVLDLDLQQVGVAGWNALTAGFPRLRSLSVRAAGIEVLEAQPWLFTAAPGGAPARPGNIEAIEAIPRAGAPLRSLALAGNGFGDVGVRALLRSPRCAALETLDLGACEVSAAGVAAIGSSTAWATLRDLRLGKNPLAGAGAAFPPEVAWLHTLDLADADLTAADVRALGSLAWVRRLWSLDLSKNPIGEAAVALAGAEIGQLGLAQCGLDVPTVIALGPTLRRARTLDLSGNPIGPALGAVLDGEVDLEELRLRDVGGLVLPATLSAPGLWRLSLSGTPLAGVGLAALLASPLLRSVVDLDLRRCALADRDLAALAAWDGLGRLNRLLLQHNDAATPPAILGLVRAVPAGLRSFGVPSSYWRLPNEARTEIQERVGPRWRGMDEDGD